MPLYPCLVGLAIAVMIWPVSPATAQEETSGQVLAKEEPQAEQETDPDADPDFIEKVLGSSSESKFTPHMLNYGVINGNDAKMQFSLKYRFIRDFGLYFAYTNLVLWDVWADSTPYRDINFKPELFYRWQPDVPWIYSVDAGYWHNSNGKDGEKDRAWDRLYGRVNMKYTLWHFDLVWLAAVYYTINKNDANDDIGDYLGWWDTAVFIRDLLPRAKAKDNLDFEYHLMSGNNGRPFDKGNQMLGLRYKFKKAAFQPHLYLQYFVGYGEVILDYNRYSEEVRFGIALAY
jgi:outer membrane phospholipase A